MTSTKKITKKTTRKTTTKMTKTTTTTTTTKQVKPTISEKMTRLSTVADQYGESLNNVSTACSHLSLSCYAWKIGGYCKTHSDWMLSNCPDACDKCQAENFKDLYRALSFT